MRTSSRPLPSSSVTKAIRPPRLALRVRRLTTSPATITERSLLRRRSAAVFSQIVQPGRAQRGQFRRDPMMG
jgi:hypothetical protein